MERVKTKYVSLSYTKFSVGEIDNHTLKLTATGNNSIPITTNIIQLIPLNNVDEPTIKIGYKKTFDVIHLYYFYHKNCCPTDVTIIENMDVQDYKLKTLEPDHWHKLPNGDFEDRIEEEGEHITIIIQFYVKQNTNEIENKLLKDVKNMFKDKLFSDATLQSSDGAYFKVHKGVLASRSEVLKAHFEHDNSEDHTNIESSFDAEVITELLNYIYTGKVNNLVKIADRLLAAADFYQLTILKNLCEEALYKQLTEENAIYILELADLHSVTGLRERTLEFIKHCEANFLFKTSAWANLESVELLKAICEYVIKDNPDSEK